MLVGVAGIDAQAHVDFYGGVELNVRSLLGEGDRLGWFVIMVVVDFPDRFQIPFSMSGHFFSFVVQAGGCAALPQALLIRKL